MKKQPTKKKEKVQFNFSYESENVGAKGLIITILLVSISVVVWYIKKHLGL